MKVNIKKVICIIMIIVCIVAIIVCFVKNKNEKDINEEYQPQEEISEEQERQTMISLYFINKTTRKLEPEARLIDVKELIADPYTVIVNLLIEGPKKDSHEKAIPEGTMLINATIEGDILKLNFSSEFMLLLQYSIICNYTFSPKVSGLSGSNCSLSHITVTRFSVSDKFIMLCVQPGII